MTDYSGFKINDSSFRDPDAIVFRANNNEVYRQINKSYKENFDLLISSGLYKKISDKNLLLKHDEANEFIFDNTSFYKTIFPEQIDIISYAYEWSFSMLKDAALLTLELMKDSLSHGMILKDATPFNVQFKEGKAIFIDTTSFEKYTEGKPWIAYRQFCENFLGPLLLMKYRNIEMNKMLTIYPDGIPLKIISELLPFKSFFNSGALMHIHFQSSVKANNRKQKTENILSSKRLLAIINHLFSSVKNLQPENKSSNWNTYYEENILSTDYLNAKKNIVAKYISSLNIQKALDMGANTGAFSELLSSKNIKTIATDSDSVCIESMYQKNDKNILPLIIDFALPTPAIGWNNTERNSFWQRCNVELILALALVHHLAIGKNISFKMIAEKLATSCKYLIIEFIPKTDKNVQLMLQNKKDIFDDYSQEKFENSFLKYFVIESQELVSDSGRTIYLFQKK